MTAPVDQDLTRQQLADIKERGVGLTLLQRRHIREAESRPAFLHKDASRIAAIHAERVPYVVRTAPPPLRTTTEPPE